MATFLPSVSVDVTHGRPVFGVGFAGFFAIWMELSIRSQYRTIDREAQRSSRVLPEHPRRRIFGSDWAVDVADSLEPLPTIQIHEAGLVVKEQLKRRFVPWAAIADVRLTADELVFERPRRYDVRCDRAVIDDAEQVVEAIERARTGVSENETVSEAEREPSLR